MLIQNLADSKLKITQEKYQSIVYSNNTSWVVIWLLNYIITYKFKLYYNLFGWWGTHV